MAAGTSGRGLSTLFATVAVVALFSGAALARADDPRVPLRASSTSSAARPTTDLVPFDRLDQALDGQLDRAAARRLRIEARLARQATENDDLAQAKVLLDAVDDTIDHLRDDGRIGDQRAAEILAAVGDVEDALAERFTAAR